MLVFGSNDVRVASHAASLFKAGWAPLIVFSGGLGNFTRGEWNEPEADIFSRIAISMGVPPGAVLIENKSTNSGENVIFSRALLEREGFAPSSFLIVQKPFMERRALATFLKAWPGKETTVSSPPIPFEAYPNDVISLEDLIHTMVGDLQRVLVYPGLGYQVFQEVPETVMDAYKHLVSSGYTKHMIKEDLL